MTSRHFLITCLVGLFWSAAAHATDVRVRVVYLKNGQPAGGQSLWLTLGDPQSKAPRLSGVTDPNGFAIFHLPDNLPNLLWLNEENGRIEGCIRASGIPVRDVMDHGVTVGVDDHFGKACKGDRAILQRIKPDPGEIVIFVRKLTVGDNLSRY
jgi:hypothetical protein